MPKLKPTYVDNSILSAVAQCSTMATLRYVLDYVSRTERPELLSGRAAASAFAAFANGATPQAAVKVFLDEYETWSSDNVPSDERLHHTNLKTILTRYFEDNPLDNAPFIVERIEVGFAFPLVKDGSIVYYGRMDKFVRGRNDSKLYVVDDKTTGRLSPSWASQFRTSSQLTGYHWGAEQHTHEQVVGSYINAVEFARLPSDPKRRCERHGVVYAECGPFHARWQLYGPYMRTPEQITRWKRDAIQLAKRYKYLCDTYSVPEYVPLVPGEGEFNKACRFCSFNEFCATGRPVRYIDSLFAKEKWAPWEEGA